MKLASESLQESPKVGKDVLAQNKPSPLPLISKTNGAKPHKPEAHSHQDLEFDCDAQSSALIPAGTNTVGFLRAEKKWLWGCEKIFLWFQILDFGEFQGVEVYMACNAPKKGNKGRMPISHKFYQAWVLAAGRKPDRFDRMSTKVFRGKLFLAQVRTVKNNAKNVARSPLLQYSLIDELLEQLTDSEKE